MISSYDQIRLTLAVLDEVFTERRKQITTWGDQRQPQWHASDPDGSVYWTSTYAQIAAGLKDRGRELGPDDSWDRTLLEEVFEALEAAVPRFRRQELVQVAAVAVKMVEELDREEAGKHGPGCELGPYHEGDCGPSALLRLVQDQAPPVPETFTGMSLPEAISQVMSRTLLPGIPQVAVSGHGVVNASCHDGARRCTACGGPYCQCGRVFVFCPQADNGSGGHDWQHPAPAPGLVCSFCSLAHKDWSGDPCERTPAPGLSRLKHTMQAGPPVVSVRHVWNGEGRLHGICRCGEGRDAWLHLCPNCGHGYHDSECGRVDEVATGEPNQCGCTDGY